MPDRAFDRPSSEPPGGRARGPADLAADRQPATAPPPRARPGRVGVPSPVHLVTLLIGVLVTANNLDPRTYTWDGTNVVFKGIVTLASIPLIYAVRPGQLVADRE